MVINRIFAEPTFTRGRRNSSGGVAYTTENKESYKAAPIRSFLRPQNTGFHVRTVGCISPGLRFTYPPPKNFARPSLGNANTKQEAKNARLQICVQQQGIIYIFTPMQVGAVYSVTSEPHTHTHTLKQQQQQQSHNKTYDLPPSGAARGREGYT